MTITDLDDTHSQRNRSKLLRFELLYLSYEFGWKIFIRLTSALSFRGGGVDQIIGVRKQLRDTVPNDLSIKKIILFKKECCIRFVNVDRHYNFAIDTTRGSVQNT